MTTTTVQNTLSPFAAYCLLGSMTLLGVFPLDVMLPSYPALAQHLHIGLADISWFLGLFAIGFALSQLVIGPLSDRYGRGRFLAAGLALAIVGALASIWASDATGFGVGRFIQGLGCGCFVLSGALVQDLFAPAQRLQVRIGLTSLAGICISLSPLLGAGLQSLADWQGSFYLFIVLAVLVLAQLALGKLPNGGIARRSLRETGTTYRQLFSHGRFVTSWVIAALGFSCHFGFIAVSPIIFLQHLHLSMSHYGLVLLIYGLAYFAAGLLAKRLAQRLALHGQLTWGLSLCGGAGLLMALMVSSGSSVTAVIIPMLLCTLGTTLVRPAAATFAMNLFDRDAGACASVGGTVVFVLAGAISVLLSCAPGNPLLILALFMIVAAMLGLGLSRGVIAR